MSQIELRYFGVSAFEITTEKGIKVVIDPCITGYKDIKFSPVGLEALPKIDIILVSHAAADHLGDTLELARKTGCDVMAGADVATYLLRSGIDPAKVKRCVWGNLWEYKGLKIRVLESHHVSWLDTPQGVLSGIPLGFILYTESGMGIYHPGDTSISLDLKLFGELYKPQLGLLPVGMATPGGGRFELSPDEAALVAKWMGLKTAIPTHYAKDSKDPEDFVRHVAHESPNTRVILMQPGEKITYKF